MAVADERLLRQKRSAELSGVEVGQDGMGIFAEPGEIPVILEGCSADSGGNARVSGERVSTLLGLSYTVGRAYRSSTACRWTAHDGEQILQRAGQPVEFPDHDHVFRPELVEQAVQFRAVPPAPGRGLLEESFHAGLRQGAPLGGGALVIASGNAKIAEKHGHGPFANARF
jgi:hypothetical protein